MDTKSHTLTRDHIHFGWDRTIDPRLVIQSKDRVQLETVDSGGGTITPDSAARDVRKLNPDRANPLTGPVYVQGAQPGDALKITILEAVPDTWAWTANIPGFGLLAEDFPDPELIIWDIAPGASEISFLGKGRVPLHPFPGVLGNCPKSDRKESSIPPRNVGGNLDTRDLGPGSELFLPVEVEGALFSAGDGHGAQGDGEVCGTGMETCMNMVLEIEVIKGMSLKRPRIVTPGPVTRHLDSRGYIITQGVAPDLMLAARQSVRDMIGLVSTRYGIDEVLVYLLLSVCADLRINEIVDEPNKIVGCYLPRCVFE